MAQIQFAFFNVATTPAFAASILLSPIVFTLWARYRTLRRDAVEAAEAWLNSRRMARALRLMVVALWWAAWDLQNPDFFASPSELLFFWSLPLLSIGISQW